MPALSRPRLRHLLQAEPDGLLRFRREADFDAQLVSFLKHPVYGALYAPHVKFARAHANADGRIDLVTGNWQGRHRLWLQPPPRGQSGGLVASAASSPAPYVDAAPFATAVVGVALLPWGLCGRV